MATQIVTLDEARVVVVPLSEEVTRTLGLKTGAHFAVRVHGSHIVLQPLLTTSLDELHGIFADPLGPDLVAELQQERRQDKW